MMGWVEVASLDDLMRHKVECHHTAGSRERLPRYCSSSASWRRSAAQSGCGRTDVWASVQPSESLKTLTYFHGGDLAELSQDDRETLVEAVQRVRELPEVALVSSELSKGDREREIGWEL